ncbi:hypothetical protein BDV33DRAFT_183034 [Aspergillus novoparasiticus]|uniref:Uncharacterized protein n=1 Tax=Aspergillus novoparasiticus TaxID=986946 RepID=A0A5N6ECX7_9EURO|nr:hypothetical protein BDV33DRAFT_183034 [Aspergillus novoparasiticus]
MFPMFVVHVCGLRSLSERIFYSLLQHPLAILEIQIGCNTVICNVPLVDDRDSGQIDFLYKLVQKC